MDRPLDGILLPGGEGEASSTARSGCGGAAPGLAAADGAGRL
jgi:hypothetical protein